jgi:hypothetical protein
MQRQEKGNQVMTAEKFKTITDIFTAWINTLALLIGGLFAATQYIEKSKSDQVASSLSFIDRYNKSPFYETRLSIEKKWLKHESEQIKILSMKSTRTVDHPKFVLEIIKSEGMERDLIALESFYSTLEACVERHICDENTAAAMIGKDADAFYMQHYAFISKIRESRQDATFGEGASKLGSRVISPDPKPLNALGIWLKDLASQS